MRFLLKFAGLLLLLYFAVSALIYARQYFAGRSLVSIRAEVRRKLRWATWLYVGLAVAALAWNLFMGQ